MTTQKFVEDIFSSMRDAGVRYAVLRNHDNFLTQEIVNKDIDVIVHPYFCSEIPKLMKCHGWKVAQHPYCRTLGYNYLYSLPAFEFYQKQRVYMDITYQLPCMTITGEHWIPLEETLQNDMWNEVVQVDNYWEYELSDIFKFIHNLTRIVFERKVPNKDRSVEMATWFHKIDKVKLSYYLETIFFKATPMVNRLLEENRYSEIRSALIKFSDY